MKLKILLSAYACEPNKGSEPKTGWKWATILPKLGHEVHVITRHNNKENIENYLAKNKIQNLYFYYFDYPSWFLKIVKRKSRAYTHFYYLIWQFGIYFLAKSLVKKNKFDFIHHVTFCSIRYPSLLCLFNVPFIFGPAGGGETIPRHLRKNLPFIDRINEFFRNISNCYIKISPLINLTFSKSSKIYVTSEESKRNIPSKYHFKTEILLALATDNFFPFSNSDLKKKNDFFHIYFCGRLIAWKGIYLALKTFSEIKKNNKNCILSIIGSGTNINKKELKQEMQVKKEIQLLAKKKNIDEFIKWPTILKREELFNYMKTCDLLLYPSMRESGGYVVLEAMTYGIPTVGLNLGGPGQLLDNECGVKIDVNYKNEDQIIAEMVKAINHLIKFPDKLNDKKIKTLKKAEEFSWKKKILKIY